MGKSCCQNKDAELEALKAEQSRLLTIVLLINAVMFVVEMGAGLYAHSSALKADSLDMLGDALVYGFSLYVVSKDQIWKARAALLKGMIMGIFGLGVLLETGFKIMAPVTPYSSTMLSIGLLAFAANAICLILLTRHKSDDINMKSVWICSRNDIIANSGVLLAAGAVFMTGSHWPDVIMGTLMATLFLQSSVGVIQEARAEQKAARSTA